MKILGKVLATMYTALFTVVLFALILVFCVSSYFKEGFISEFLSSDVIMDTKIADLDFEGKQEILDKCGESATIEDAIVIALQEEMDISSDLIKEVINDKDIQKELGKGLNQLIKFETTGVAPELKYEDYEYLLEKDVVKQMMKELEITKTDIKKLIDEYNKHRDEYHTSSGLGGSQYDAVTRVPY